MTKRAPVVWTAARPRTRVPRRSGASKQTSRRATAVGPTRALGSQAYNIFASVLNFILSTWIQALPSFRHLLNKGEQDHRKLVTAHHILDRECSRPPVQNHLAQSAESRIRCKKFPSSSRDLPTPRRFRPLVIGSCQRRVHGTTGPVPSLVFSGPLASRSLGALKKSSHSWPCPETRKTRPTPVQQRPGHGLSGDLPLSFSAESCPCSTES